MAKVKGVRLVDKELRAAFRKLQDQYSGKKSLPPARKFVRYKQRRVHLPFVNKGYTDENGMFHKWEANGEATTIKKLKLGQGQWQVTDHKGRPTGKTVNSPWDAQGMQQIKRKKVKPTMSQRRSRILVDSGQLKDNIRAGFSRKRSEFHLSVRGIAGQVYAWVMLHGNPRNQVVYQEWVPPANYDQQTLAQRRAFQGWKPVNKKKRAPVPARPWGEWSSVEITYLRDIVLSHMQKELR